MSNGIYDRGKYAIENATFNGSTDLRLLLVNSSYSFNAGTHHVVSDVSANEISVAGYSRQALTTKAINEDDTNHFAYLSADNVTFSGLAAGQTIGGAILYIYNASDASANLIAFYDVTDTATNGGDIIIQWATAANGGVLKLS